MTRTPLAVAALSALVLFAGCGGGTSSVPTPAPGTPLITLSASSLTFPSTAVGQTSAAQTVSVANTGTASAILSSYALSGDTTDFNETASNCGATLAAGATCIINLVFQPAAAGSFSLIVTVTDNASNSPQTLTLTGIGTAAQGPVPSAAFTSPTMGVYFTNTAPGSTATENNIIFTNSGNATLSIASIAITGSNASVFGETTTCGATLAAATSCTFTVSFTPTAASTTYAAGLTVTDNSGNVTGSTQTLSLGGSSNSTSAPQALLSSNSIAFPTTQVNATSGSYSITLSNPGNATLTGIAITLGGTNSADFAETTTCGSTLAALANCSISATFTPAAANSYIATISVASSATTTPQTIALSGTGSTSAISYKLYTFPETDNSITPLYALINSAQKTIDMTMYELQDSVFTADLVAACARGVKVRVILSSSEASQNATDFAQINAGGANCSAVESNSAFVNTHQKTITVDNSQTAIMSLNLQTVYYSTTRDFAMVENDPVDIAAIETTFAQDYAAGGTNSPTEFAYQPPPGDDLIWSPTTAQADMLGLINNATKTIILENEEMSASNIVSALEAACQRGVTVHIAMVADSSYTANFNALTAAGCGVYLYPDTQTGFYVHAKAVVADYGLSTQKVYMGSINYSTASMTENRELGMYITDPTSITSLYTTLTQDYTGNPSY